ncbi:MAG: TRAP transporter substrate-binding protein DctP [Gammaproteobacteria bacterium]|nr:TRAP transporter substrate-binding protein DctP [Gammaproteobacteria bacterium]
MKLHKLLAALIFLSAACLTHSTQAITFKIASIAPEGSFWMEMMKDGAKHIKTETHGRVKFKFYSGGVMGSQATVLKKMHIGQLQGGIFTSGTLGALYPDSQIYSLPLVFKSLNEVDYVRQKMDAEITSGLDEADLTILGISEGGMTYVMSDQPVLAISDLKQHKIWSPQNNINVTLTLEALDVSAISLPIGDVLISLQTGLIDTVATSPAAAIALQWHTYIKYITDMPLIYFYSVLALDKKAFERVSREDQAIIRRVMADTVKKIDSKNREDNIAALTALQNQGIKIIKPDPQQRENWYKKGNEANALIFNKGGMSKMVINEMMAHIAAFRSRVSGI